MRVTHVSAMSSARPVAMVLVSSATGSPLAWMGHPKNAQKPQLLQAGRPSYSTLLAAVGAGYGWRPIRSAAAADSTAPYMGAPGGIGYGPERQAANGLAPASP